MIRKRRITLTASGGTGASSASATLSLGRPGIFRAFSIDYTGTGTSSADLTVKADSVSGATLLTKTNTETDVTGHMVMSTGYGSTDAAADANGGSSASFQVPGVPFGTGLYFSLAQADSGDVAVIDVWVEL